MNEKQIEQERLEYAAKIHELEQENEKLKEENVYLRVQLKIATDYIGLIHEKEGK